MKRFLALMVLAVGSANAMGTGISFYLGYNWALPTNLLVKQEGYPDTLVEAAHFDTHPFDSPIYYGTRIWYGPEEGTRAEVELIHSKLYFDGAESGGEVFDRFTATDGFNFLLFNLAYFEEAGDGEFGVRAGVGPMIPHPESSVRGQVWGQDGNPAFFHLGGIGAQVGASYNFLVDTPDHWPLGIEAKWTYADSHLNISGGQVEGIFNSFHLTFGPGYRP
jgi:hypothetical protein